MFFYLGVYQTRINMTSRKDRRIGYSMCLGLDNQCIL